MPGNYQNHLDRFGICTNPSHSGIEMMDLEVEDERGFTVEKIPACEVCFGLK